MEEIFDLDIIDAIRPTIDNANEIIIIGHKNPDGDCLGSALGLANFFENKQKKVKIIVPNEIPEFFSWLKGINDILIYNQSPWEAVNYISSADIIFMLDFNSFSRIDDIADSVQVSNSLKIVIDHHQEPEAIADFSFIDHQSSSAAELVYKFMKIIDKNSINKVSAEFIFAGIVSDTGSFKYDSANTETFAIASELLKYNIDKSFIIRGLYANYSFNRLQLLGFALSQRTEFLEDQNVAFMYLSEADKTKFNYKHGDHEDFVNWPLAISGVNISALFIEVEEVVRISLRSRGNYDVNKVARKYFNGGGHKNAAGGKSFLSLNQTVNFFKENIHNIINTALLKDIKK
jgi:phosphoesterase RecJ-like protein